MGGESERRNSCGLWWNRAVILLGSWYGRKSRRATRAPPCATGNAKWTGEQVEAPATSVQHLLNHFDDVRGDGWSRRQARRLHADEVDGLGDGRVAGDYEVGVAFASWLFKIRAPPRFTLLPFASFL